VLLLIHYHFQKFPSLSQVGKRFVKLILLLTLAGVILVTVAAIRHPKITEFIYKRQEMFGSAMENRWAEYRAALNQWLTSPLWGSGFGVALTIEKVRHTREQDYIHHFIFQFLVSSGIFGLLLIFTLLGGTILQLLRLLKKSSSILQSTLCIVSLLTVMNIIVVSSTQTVILKQDTYFLMAILISFAIIIKRWQRQGVPVGVGMNRGNAAAGRSFGVRGLAPRAYPLGTPLTKSQGRT